VVEEGVKVLVGKGGWVYGVGIVRRSSGCVRSLLIEGVDVICGHG
jgi:hypothetical protein